MNPAMILAFAAAPFLCRVGSAIRLWNLPSKNGDEWFFTGPGSRRLLLR